MAIIGGDERPNSDLKRVSVTTINAICGGITSGIRDGIWGAFKAALVVSM